MSYTIKQVSKMLNIPIDSLRYYDTLGIVSPQRAENRYRYYEEKDLQQLRYVAVMKYAHFSLVEIQAVMERFSTCDTDISEECNRIVYDIFATKLAMLESSIKNLQHVSLLLETLLPMMNSPEAYFENQKQVDTYISDIYTKITSEKEQG